MTDTACPLALRPSVAAYLTDAATRAGVDALVAIDADALPPELEWDELGDYLAARAAAELVRSEYAITVHALWRAVWEPVIAAGWGVPDLDDLDAEMSAVSPETCWDEKSFYLYHEDGDLALYTLVQLDRRGATLAFSIERGDSVLIDGGMEGFTWRDDDDWSGWMKWSRSVTVEGGSIDCGPLAEAAAVAMAAATDATSKRRSPPKPTPRKLEAPARAPRRARKS